jgi:hypothetical protein
MITAPAKLNRAGEKSGFFQKKAGSSFSEEKEAKRLSFLFAGPAMRDESAKPHTAASWNESLFASFS